MMPIEFDEGFDYVLHYDRCPACKGSVEIDNWIEENAYMLCPLCSYSIDLDEEGRELGYYP